MATDQITAVIAVVQETIGQAVEGVYLYGSAVAGALRPASDLDLFVVTSRRTTQPERRLLTERLTPISSLRERPANWRPVELTIVSGSDVRPWRYPPLMDFQYGEWLRSEIDAGTVAGPRTNPDLAVLVSMVLIANRPLAGPPAPDLLDPVPRADLASAMVAAIPGLLDDLESDTTNVLLTLARIWHTLASDEFSPKDVAADWAIERLPEDRRRALERARDDYRVGSWSEFGSAVKEDAAYLVQEIRHVANGADRGP